MATATKTQWTTHTFNPWRGCTKVSPGCANCYAEQLSRRNPAVLGEWGPQGVRVVAAESYWRQPLAWDRAAAKAGERRRVFCASLADVFEDRDELAAPRRRLARLIWDTPHLDWLLLTKRPENANRMIYEMWFEDAEWPKNYWLGVSVENQAAADERIPLLLQTPAAVRFLSVEPLLGPVNLAPWLSPPAFPDGRYEAGPGRPVYGCDDSDPFSVAIKPITVNWVIVGGESGPNARPCDLAWVRSIVKQCHDAGVACFVKQLGSRPFDSFYRSGVADQRLHLRDKKGGDPSEWPEDLCVREFPSAPAVPQ